MRRVSRQPFEEGPLLEEQETEGQRQLHSLLLQQLHTDANIDRCVAKKQCFAPASLYRPFGAQAAGVRSLSQFRALQDGERELACLRERGLTDSEIQLWQSRDALEAAQKTMRAAPDAKQQRLQVIRDKMEARAELLARPQRFAASRPLSRREMEIEQALYQGTERPGFLSALYHREDESTQDDQKGALSSDPLDSLYTDVLSSEKQASRHSSGREPAEAPHEPPLTAEFGKNSQEENSRCKGAPEGQTGWAEEQPAVCASQSASHTSLQKPTQDRPTPPGPAPPGPGPPGPAGPLQLDVRRPIRSLCGAAGRAGGPLALRGEVRTVTDEEILRNRESEEGIRNIPRFQNYQPGKPSKVLCVKNLSTQASVAQLVELFSRFERKGGPPVLYRLLTGRMKGQAFITLPDTEMAQNALGLVHGYRLLGKPLVVEFGRERQEEKKLEEKEKDE
ncbi:RNA-binding protein 41 isoform 1-T2 [Menidia menidia]